MSYKGLICIAIFLIMLSSGYAQAQQTVAVFGFDAIGVDRQTSEAASQIFRTELGATGKFAVMTKGDMETGLQEAGIYDFSCYDAAGAARKAGALGADKAIIGSLTGLGGKIIVEVQLIDVERSEVDFTDRFSSSTTEDLDIVLRRLARAVASRKKVESDANKFAVTDDETRESRRKKSYITSGFSFGFGFPIGDSSYSDVDNLKALAWTMRYEAGRFIVDNSLGINWGTAKVRLDTLSDETENKGVLIFPWDIGLRYLLIPESDLTPYVGAGLGFHFIFSAKVNDIVVAKNDQAMALHLATGLYAFQSYDFRLTVDVKYTVVFSDAFYGSDKTSQQISISIGIARKWKSGQKRILFIF